MIERNVQYFNEPFKYAIIDNFFSDEDYKQVIETLEHNEKTIEFRNGSIDSRVEGTDPEQVCDWTQDPNELLAPYFEYIASLEYLKLDPERQFSTTYRYNIRSKTADFKPYPIHTENIFKAMSLVVYIGEKNFGTDIYDNDRRFFKEIEWKDNRAYVMCGYSNQKGKLPGNNTWHGYRIAPNTIRRSVFGYVCTTEESCQQHSLRDYYSANRRNYEQKGPAGVMILKRYAESDGILFGEENLEPREEK